jgi:hypothetical protein
MNKIGLVLNFPVTTGSSSLDVDSVKIYADNKILVRNLQPGAVVELVDSFGNTRSTAVCKANTDHVYLDMTNLSAPFNGQIKVSLFGSSQISTVSDIWGGDVYWYGLLVEVYRNNTLLSKDVETNLGYMVDGKIDNVLVVKNPSAQPIQNVTIKGAKYFDYMGNDWVKFADDLGYGPGNFFDSLSIGILQPAEERKFWVRVSKDFVNAYSHVGEHKFLIEVETG